MVTFWSLSDDVSNQQLNIVQLNIVASWWFFHHSCIIFASSGSKGHPQKDPHIRQGLWLQGLGHVTSQSNRLIGRGMWKTKNRFGIRPFSNRNRIQSSIQIKSDKQYYNICRTALVQTKLIPNQIQVFSETKPKPNKKKSIPHKWRTFSPIRF